MAVGPRLAQNLELRQPTRGIGCTPEHALKRPSTNLETADCVRIIAEHYGQVLKLPDRLRG